MTIYHLFTTEQEFSSALEEYMSGSHTAKRVSEEEARKSGGIPITREFTIETRDLRECDDKYSLLGHCSIQIEHVFCNTVLEHRIQAFTGYTITTLPDVLGFTFRVSTILVPRQ
ncbi:hypothetical protein ACFYKX_10740 [Cytobacillus sp. FJAT-54145]|uniref:Uncharacterized protein n=1 Tax=Cytobacillus spartinae TaxID=3299023 RepID=A0ABW6KA55_9BACI